MCQRLFLVVLDLAPLEAVIRRRRTRRISAAFQRLERFFTRVLMLWFACEV